MTRKRVLPPTYLLVAILAMIGLYFLLPMGTLAPFPWNLAGVVPLLIGLVLAIIADRAFKEHKTTVKPFEPSSVLVTEGTFSFSRHPMYLGFVLLLLGIAVLLGALAPFVVVLVFAVLMDQVFIRVEERMMEEQFGDAWRAYKRRVRRWL